MGGGPKIVNSSHPSVLEIGNKILRPEGNFLVYSNVCWFFFFFFLVLVTLSMSCCSFRLGRSHKYRRLIFKNCTPYLYGL
jgi:hypothetical protein